MAEGYPVAVANAILLAQFHGTAYQGVASRSPGGGTAPGTSWFVQLHTSDPGVNGTTGVANSGRRVALGSVAVSAGQGTNANDIVFVAVTTNQTYQGISFWDTATVGGGNLLETGGLVGSGTAGNDFTISAGQITFSLLTTG